MDDFLDQWVFRGKASGQKESSRTARLPNHVGGRGQVSRPSTGPTQRVIVKVSPVKNAAGGRAAAHMSYLLREGAGKDGDDPIAFGKDAESPPKTDEFLKTCEDDRHAFRVIISPENAAKLDLESYAREVVERFEADLKTPLEWVGVAHYNTDQPHVHLVIRGVDDRGKDLFIQRDYVGNTARQVAEDVATYHLGPRTEHDIAEAARRAVLSTNFIQLDRSILAQSKPSKGPEQALEFRIPRHIEGPGVPDGHALTAPEKRALVRDRLMFLAKMEVIEPVHAGDSVTPCRMQRGAPNVWRVPQDLEARIRFYSETLELSERLTRAGRPNATQNSEAELFGRVVARGFKDDHKGGEYLVVDAVDGKSYYLDAVTPSLSRADVSRRVGPGDVVAIDSTTVGEGGKIADTKRKIQRLGVGDLRDSIHYDGPTWLDRQLVAPLSHAQSQQPKGFGKDYAAAIKARQSVLEARGIVPTGEAPPGHLLKILRDRERSAHEVSLATKHHKQVVKLQVGSPFEGEIHHRVSLPGGNYAAIIGAEKLVLVRCDKHLDSFSQGTKVRISLSRNAEGRVRQFVELASPGRQNSKER